MEMKLVLSSVFLFLLVGCEIINQDEDIPSILSIEAIEVQGNHTTKITDAWIYVDSEFQGVFPLPTQFPLLKTGQQTIIVDAGIKKNGIASSRDNYPYFTSYSIETNLIPNQNITLIPKLTIPLTAFHLTKILKVLEPTYIFYPILLIIH